MQADFDLTEKKMQAEINGTTIRFVSSGNGLERAAFDFNSGPPTGHLHVYVTSVFQDTGRQYTPALTSHSRRSRLSA